MNIFNLQIQSDNIVFYNSSITISWEYTLSNNIRVGGCRLLVQVSEKGEKPSFDSYTYSRPCSFSSKRVIFQPGFLEDFKNLRGQKLAFALEITYINTNTGASQKAIRGFNRIITINSAPLKPEVTVNKTLVPSAGGEVEFYLSSSQGRGYTFFYAFSLDSEKIEIPNPNRFLYEIKEADVNKTFYFWKNDGVSFSEEYTSITIIKNQNPLLNFSFSGTKLNSVNNQSGKDYIVRPFLTLTENNSSYFRLNNIKFNCKILYQTSKEEPIKEKIFLQSVSYDELNILMPDLRSLGLDHERNGVYYKISLQSITDLEVFENWIKSTNEAYITKLPAITRISNGLDNSSYYQSDGIASYCTHYSKKLDFNLEGDAGYDTLIFYDRNQTMHSINLSLTEQGHLSYLQGAFQEVDEKIYSQYDFDIKYKLEKFNGYSSSEQSLNRKITKIASAKLSNFVFNPNNYNYFTDLNFSFISSIAHGYSNAPQVGGLNFGFSSNAEEFSKYISLKLKYNTEQEEVAISFNNEITDNNTLRFTLLSNSLYNALKNLMEKTKTSKNSDKTIEAKFLITNDFGDISEIKTNFIVSFLALDKIKIISEKIYAKGKKNDLPLKNFDRIIYIENQLDKLYCSFKIESYNPLTRIEIQVKSSLENTWKTLKSFFESEANKTFGDREKITYSFSGEELQNLSDIAIKAYTIQYQIIIYTTVGNITLPFYRNFPYEMRGHSSPIISIQNCIPENFKSNEKNYTHKLLYKVVDEGIAEELVKDSGIYESIELKLYSSREGQLEIENVDFLCDTEGKQRIIRFTPRFDSNEEYILAKIWTESNITSTNGEEVYISTKQVDLDQFSAFAIFNKLPTVSYRPNYLGINTSSLENERAIITIGPSMARNEIYYKPISTDLCIIRNFNICGGSWDNTPANGVISGGDNVLPSGLAAIATEPDIIHLEQRYNNIIIFSGGTAGSHI